MEFTRHFFSLSFLFFFLTSSISKPGGEEMSYAEFKPMSDFIFEQVKTLSSIEENPLSDMRSLRDTVALEKALLFCDSILSADVVPFDEYKGDRKEFNRKKNFFHLGYKSRILSVFDRYAEAFEMYGKSVELGTDTLDKYIFYGMKFSLMNEKDSSDYYFSKVIREFEGLKDYNIGLIFKRILVFYWLDQDEELNEFIDSLSAKYPEHEELLNMLRSNEMARVRSLLRDFREKIKKDSFDGKIAH